MDPVPNSDPDPSHQGPGQALQVLTLLKTWNIMFRESIPREQICHRLFQLRQSPGQALQVLTLLETCNIMFRVDSKGTNVQ